MVYDGRTMMGLPFDRVPASFLFFLLMFHAAFFETTESPRSISKSSFWDSRWHSHHLRIRQAIRLQKQFATNNFCRIWQSRQPP